MIMMLMDIDTINNIVAIGSGIVTIIVGLVTIINLYIKKLPYDFLFSNKNIQAYKVFEFKFIMLNQKLKYIIFAPSSLFLLWKFISNYIWNKSYNYYIILLYSLLSLAIIILYDNKKNELLGKLKRICSQIDEDSAKQILSGSNNKNYFSIILINFFIMIPICLINLNTLIGNTLLLFEFFLYIILTNVTMIRYAIYKNRIFILPDLTIQLDYEEAHNCLCKINIKMPYSYKIENGIIIIYYPGDVGAYIIPQKHLISAQVGYKVIDSNNIKETKRSEK